MINEADPFIRLKALQVYMNRWIDEWPHSEYGFGKFFRRYYAYENPGTIEYAKRIATHCFYCEIKLLEGRDDKSPKRSSVDHYLPLSLGTTERYVICCAACNTSKGNISPKNLVRNMTRAYLRGQMVWGLKGERLKFAYEQIQRITNDMLYKRGPRIYYIKK